MHNRHLRSRFDAAVESRGENAAATASATPAVEYLLVGEDPTRPSGDLERVAEEGSEPPRNTRRLVSTKP